MDQVESGWERLTRSSTAILGAGAGAGVSLLLADPVAGAMAGQAMVEIGNDIARRILSPREEQRIGTVLVLAAGGVVANQALGMTIRDDGFFDGERSDADEIIEGVLLAARDEHEEKKLPYLANLLARMPFLEGIGSYVLNEALESAEALSWLELQVLAIVSRPDDFPLPNEDYNRKASGWNDWAISEAFFTMTNEARQLLYHPHGEPTSTLGLGRYDLRMSSIKRTNLGLLLADLLELHKMPRDELQPVYEALLRGATPTPEPES